MDDYEKYRAALTWAIQRAASEALTTLRAANYARRSSDMEAAQSLHDRFEAESKYQYDLMEVRRRLESIMAEAPKKVVNHA